MSQEQGDSNQHGKYPRDMEENTIPTPPSHDEQNDLKKFPISTPDKRYDISGEFAKGGIGRILKAYDNRLGRPVAIKELLYQKPEIEERFLREALITAKLEHPAIVPVHDVGRWHSGEPFYSMKFVSGKSLAEVLKTKNTLENRLFLLPHVIAVCEAIAYAHETNIVHRDLKPANILVGEFGETVVIDWGLAKDLKEIHCHPNKTPLFASCAFEEKNHKETTCSPGKTPSLSSSVFDAPPTATIKEGLITKEGSILGTPAYMSPEQAHAKPIDERADVYSLGSMLYHLLSGTPPYSSKTSRSTLTKLMAGPPVPLESKEPNVPKDLLAIVQKAMARASEERYPSAKELTEDLKKFQTGQLVGAHRYSTSELLRRWVKRHKGALVVAVLALLILSVGGVYSVLEIVAGRQFAEVKRKEAEQKELLAKKSEKKATASLDSLLLDQARAAREKSPQQTLALLKQLSPQFPSFSAARMLAADVLSRSIPQILEGHEGVISSFAFSPDAKTLASSDANGFVYLWNLSTGRRRTLQKHDNWVLETIFSKSGNLLATSAGSTIHIWDFSKGTSKVLKGHTEFVTQLVFSADESTLFSAGWDRTIRAWDLLTGTEKKLFDGHEEAISFLTLSPDGNTLASAGSDFTIRLWNIQTGTSRVLYGLKGVSSQLAFSPDSTLLASVGAEKVVRLWDVKKAKEKEALVGHQSFLQSVRFSPDGTKIASAGNDKTIRIWEWFPDTNSSNAQIRSRVLFGHEKTINEIDFSPDGTLLASASDDYTVRLWDVETGQQQELYTHKDLVAGVQFSSNGTLLASVSADKTIGIKKIPSHSSLVLSGHTDEVWNLSFSPDATLLASASLDNTVRIWNLSDQTSHVLKGDKDDQGSQGFSTEGKPIFDSFDPSARVRFLARVVNFSPDGTQLASAGLDGRVWIWDVKTRTRRTFRGHKGRVRTFSFSPDGTQLATASLDGTVGLWNVETKEARFLAHEVAVLWVSFSPDGTQIVSSDFRGTVNVWDVHTGNLVKSFSGFNEGVSLAIFSPDNQKLAFANVDGSIKLCTVKTDICHPLLGHVMSVFHMTFSPNGKWLATASEDDTARLWNVKTGESRVLRGHESGVRQVGFSPDSLTLATASLDKTARLWDVKTGESRVLRGHEKEVMAVAFSPEGQRLATASVDKTVRIWNDFWPQGSEAIYTWLSTLILEKDSPPARSLPTPIR